MWVLTKNWDKRKKERGNEARVLLSFTNNIQYNKQDLAIMCIFNFIVAVGTIHFEIKFNLIYINSIKQKLTSYICD